MSNRVVFTPQYYPLPTIGRAVPSGSKIYVGVPDLDPSVIANQKQVSVLQEDTTLVQVAQPILTGAGGVPLHNGSPVTLFVEGDYSVRVDDPNDAQIYFIPRTQSQEATGTQFPTFAIDTTYAQNAYVTGSDNRLYYSIAGANLGNDPTSTTGFWQGVVEVGDVATETASGTIELATQAEVDTGTDTDRAVTPATLAGTSVPNATKVGGLNVKVVDIGDWDMVATSAVNIVHGIASGISKIRVVTAQIIRDDGADTKELNSGLSAVDTTPQGFSSTIIDTTVKLTRLTGGQFDSINYDLTPFNRGHITIWFTD